MRARVSGGLTFQGANGARLGAQGFYDGLGDDNFEAYGGKVKLVLPIQ